jgi:AcrR family transcriptional regulator
MAVKKTTRVDAQNSLIQIMKKAEHVLNENPAATLLEIAKAAGLTRVTIYRHFKDRAELLEVLTVHAFREMVAVAKAINQNYDSFLPALESLTLELLKSAGQWRAVSSHPRMSKPVQKLRAELVVLLENFFKKGIKESYIHPKSDLLWLRMSYMGLIKQAKYKEKSMGYDEKKIGRLIVNSLLHGAAKV